MNNHAELSPSSADRWMTCQGSVVLSKGIARKTSVFADEGTLAHSVAEAFLTGKPIPSDVTQEMFKHVAVYTNYVRELKGKLLVEQRVKVNDQVYGTADAILWDKDALLLHVIDLKYGAGVAVEVKDNIQLKIYALASLLTFGYKAETVMVSIVQPRFPHKDGFIRSVTFDPLDLLDLYADIKESIAIIESAKNNFISADTSDFMEMYLKPTEKGCRWCPASAVCPAIKAKTQELAKKVFSPSLSYNPADLSETLEFLPIIEAWAKNVREFAYSETENGVKIPGWKLVEKQANRKFKPNIAESLMRDFILSPDQIFKPQELLGVGEIEKLMPGKNAKIRAEALAPYVTRESSGKTLVRDTDTRPSIVTDAKLVFANL